MPTIRHLFRSPLGGFTQPLEDLRDEFDRFVTALAEPRPLQASPFRRTGAVAPAVNVSESDAAVTIEAELPGLAAGDIDISVSGDEFVLKGGRPAAAGAGAPPAGDGEQAGVTWHRRERGTGAFERRITLPVAVDAARVEARLADGVLTVTCPKAPECQPHKVTVRSA